MNELILKLIAGILPIWALCAQSPADAMPNATVGAYYFEGWYHDTPQSVAAFANAELRNSYPEREPIWGGGLWRGDTVEVMEQQIDLAADHGIAFFSFDWYWYGSAFATANDGINSGLYNFMQASNRDRMQFNINIVDAGPTTIDSDAEWRQVADMLLPFLSDSQYLRVGGNPLVTNFNAAGMTQTNYNYFQQIASAAGISEVEFAANVAGSTSLYTHLTRYNAVPGWGAGEVEMPYQSLTDYVEGNDTWAQGIWKTESGGAQSYIPTVMTGWDARPWNTPPTWYFNPTRTPQAVAAHLQEAIDWIDDNPALATPERLGMLFAWNEFGEGGYIAPTLGDPNGLYLDAIKSVVLAPQIPGDFNGDQQVSGTDIDLLRNAIALNSTDPTFDVNGDQVVSSADVSYLLADILDTNLADVNLDGSVDAGDVAVFRSHIGHTQQVGAAPWDFGNISGDSTVDQIDLLALRHHFGFARSSTSQSVPEPCSALFLAIAGISLLRHGSPLC